MTAPAPARPRPRTRFHPLPVAAVRPAAADGSAVLITLRVPPELRAGFAFAPGQHLVVRADLDGAEARRSYSLCSVPAELARDGTLRIAVRAVDGGAYSSYATRRLRPGDLVEALPPAGRFALAPGDPGRGRGRRIAALAAGSGITPLLSMAAAVLAAEPDSTVTLLAGDRGADTAMLTEELADLKDRHRHRLRVLRVFSREERQAGLPAGRLDRAGLRALLPRLLPAGAHEWYVCGPPGMVEAAEEVLAERGTAHVRTELFTTRALPAGPPPAPPRPPDGSAGSAGAEVAAAGCELTVRLDGRSSVLRVPAGANVLDAALAARPETPYSCRTGVCATCRAKVVLGRVDTEGSLALGADESADGYVLTCRSTVGGERVTVDFDAL
ncbi:phenylacetate-CoA oxygenase/reductase subunit PaaK [Kitasatospora saccharophila]|uniref:Phenylacetate-CoA oxygenase/reductase subunit PaaK n=1 Tax=Kitasatospora saccharophila TaxID=407973 RepID=A0ABP5JCX8_9ACTN